MGEVQLIDQIHLWANTVLVWIGFGTVVGLLAKAIMPGRDPGGAIATLAMGIGGTILGCGTLSLFSRGAHVSPISLVGLLVATGGAFVMLLLYRLISGYWWIEGIHRPPHQPHRRYARTRRRIRYVEE